MVDSFESVYFEINVIETTHLLKPPKKFPGKKCLEQKPIKEEIVGVLEWKNKNDWSGKGFVTQNIRLVDDP